MEPVNACTLARYLHDVYCGDNHADACAWYYEINRSDVTKLEIHNWSQSTHKRWLRRANDLASKFNIPITP